MQDLKISKKKPSYPVNEKLHKYLNEYNRIRGPYCKFRLKYKNEEDKRFILHQLNTLFQPMIV